MSGLTAAATTVDLTPGAVGLPIGGNSRRDKIARGVHDPIQATVVILRTADEPPVIVASLDLVTLPSRLVSALAAALNRGIGPHQLFASATHTHSAPDVDHGLGFDQADYSGVDRWVDAIAERVAAAAGGLLVRLGPARIRVGQTELTELAFNRRHLTTSGRVAMNWEATADLVDARPLGPVDDTLTVLALVDDEDRPIAALLHFALHPAILVGHEWLLSADFVGPARDQFAATLGEVPVAYLNGAMGNVNHIDARRGDRPIGFAESERVGARVGAAAVVAYGAAASPSTHLHSRRFDVELRQRTVDPAGLSAARACLAAAGPDDFDAIDGIPPAAYAAWTVQRGAMLTPQLTVTTALLRLGDAVLVYLPFEVFCEFGLWLRRLFAARPVLVVSLGGGGLGYLPTAAAFAEGGYEPTYGTSTVARGEGERLLFAVARAVSDLLEHQ